MCGTRAPTLAGFRKRRRPLFDVVDTIDVLPKQPRCVTGLAKCSDDMPCSMHDTWTVLRLQIYKYLRRTNIAALSARVNGIEPSHVAASTILYKRTYSIFASSIRKDSP